MRQEAELKPGDLVMFKCGSQFNGPIHITESGTKEKPITLTADGKGKAPRFTNPNDLNMNGNCIRTSGSYLIVKKLHFHDTPPTKHTLKKAQTSLRELKLNVNLLSVTE